tara:strand:- start:27050 stop:28177 length:1128 start_codon:yes stop_codon:yes gene_type:complete
MKHEYYYHLLLLVLMVTLISSCSDPSPIYIGYSGQLTGKISDLGVNGRNGAILAVEHINAHNGINGRPLKLIVKDDLNTAEGAIKADQELIDAGVVGIIGHMTSSQVLAAMPLVNESGVVMISPTASTPYLTGKADSFFRTIMENTVQSRELSHYAHSAMDIKTVLPVVEQDNESYTFSFLDGFKRSFSYLGGAMLSEEVYSAKSAPSNWDHLVDRVSMQNPDAILLICPGEDAVSIAHAIRNAGLETTIISSAWAYTEQLIKWGGQHVESIIFAIDYAADNPNPEFIKFRESYKNRFGTTPNFASAFSYESVLALAEGLRKTNGNSKGLVESLAPSPVIKGVINSFRLNEYGDVERKIFITTIQNGQYRTIEMR